MPAGPVHRVTAADGNVVIGLDGEMRVYSREELHFGYRETNLPAGIVAWASLRVSADDPVACRTRVKEYFAYKKSTQPMSASSAGCMFRNPTLANGSRESAGKLIDDAGLKGTRVGGALVSPQHGNFIVVEPGARASDVAELAALVADETFRRTGVRLEREVVFWRRGEA
jgi:UDP-N-acetylmuramate dehydrogenase